MGKMRLRIMSADAKDVPGNTAMKLHLIECTQIVVMSRISHNETFT